ncbi:hypothetical protein [Bradyrhizobium sp.]|uniref:hypothetical protein n=1 Tax=Bradyrhizobium sp. TaxID=376 RepID=UPI0040383E16
MPSQPPRRRISPVSIDRLSIKQSIDTELALYNRTGNMLALWAVVGICARKGLPLPPGVRSRVLKIASKLLKHADDNTLRARELVADIVLGTRNASSGPSVFNEYQLEKRNAAIVARVRELLMQDLAGLSGGKKVLPGHSRTKNGRGSSKSGVTRKSRAEVPELPAIRSQTAIYGEVAKEHAVTPQTVKRLFEQDDREAGSFSYRTIRKNRYRGGIIDI